MRPFGSGRLRHARLQAVLAVAAIGTAVALPVVLISVGGGVAHHELEHLENAGYQVVVSAPGFHGIQDSHNLSATIAGLSDVAAAAPILSVAIDAFNATGTVTPVLAEGVVPGSFHLTLGPTEAPLFPDPLPLGDPTDTVHFANGTYTGPATYDVIVSSTYAQAHRVTLNQTIWLSPSSNFSDAVAYRVTGFFGVPLSFVQPAGADAVLLPLSDLQVLTGLATGSGTIVPDASDTIEVVVAGSAATDPNAIASVARSVQAVVSPYYSVSTLSQEAQQLASASAVLTGFYLALSSVGLAVGLLFLALVLLRRVENDRRGIGIRRALGLPSSWIAAGYLRDGALLAAIGAVAGVVGGVLVVQALATWGSDTVRLAARLAEFDPIILAEIGAGLVALSLVASGVATRSALRTEIVEALR